MVELLTVIALIIAIAALAVPNFAAMIREHHWTSAVSALQSAVMRARTYAVNDEIDHAVEFCTDQDGTSYLRIEAESAYLESVPNLQQFISLVDTFMGVPDGWVEAFLARRDAWGPDGNRLYSGVIDIYWAKSGGGYGTGWGHMRENVWTLEHTNLSRNTRCCYDSRYPNSKANLTWPWQCPAPGDWNAMSSAERNNVPGDADGHFDSGDGYMDVNDSSPYSMFNRELRMYIRDNLAVDDFLYLPHDIHVDLSRSTLVNLDAAKGPSGRDVAEHGWDGTPDLRFAKSGHLLQAQTPDVVLKRGDDQFMQLRLIRGTGRLRKVD